MIQITNIFYILWLIYFIIKWSGIPPYFVRLWLAETAFVNSSVPQSEYTANGV